jgi:DNA-binding winged helix-turn-helix (wHTH) protein/TolB-like protein
MGAGRVRFGIFEFDGATGELRRDGALVRLAAQPAQVLGCLIARAGQVVTREELCSAVWGAETFVDFERGLNFCIAQVRSAFGDEATTPTFIRTVPKRGYQFIAPVEVLKTVEPERATTAVERKFSPRTAVLLGAAALGVIAAFCAGYVVRAKGIARHAPIVAVVRFDNETGDPGMTRFADGLTDDVVEQLTVESRQRYGVVGNAKILRVGREQWDLASIAASLHAEYVVLGQVQSGGAGAGHGSAAGTSSGSATGASSGTRILAHLIRMPDQTHVWVTRVDGAMAGPSADPLAVEVATAQKIGAALAPRVVEDSSGKRLPPFPSH